MSDADVDLHKLTIFSSSLTILAGYGKNYVKDCGIKLLVNPISRHSKILYKYPM